MSAIIRYKTFSPDAQVPYRKHDTDAGYDLSATHGGIIEAGQVAMPVRTGIGLELPDNIFALIRDRSSVAAKGVITTAGVIDPGYRGEVVVLLTNMGREPFVFEKGQRIAQVLLLPCSNLVFKPVEDLADSSRGSGGFGSTGTGSLSQSSPEHQVVS